LNVTAATPETALVESSAAARPAGTRPSHPGRVLAAFLLLAGLALPPAATALWLRGDTPVPSGLVAGLWLLKALLVWHAAALYLVGRRYPRADRAPALPALGTRAVLLLLGAGIALRLPGLGRGLWYDEIQTLLDYVRQPFGILVTTFDSSNQHLLFSVAAHLCRAVLGDSVLALRLPAMLFGVLSLWAAVAFGRRWMPTREAWWSAVILAVSYHHIWFSQNARGYTGLMLGTLVASTLFIDLLRRGPTRARIWAYAVVMALTVVTHVTALVVLAAHGLCWLATVRRAPAGAARSGPFVAMLLAGSVAVACYAPVLPQLLGAVGESGTAVTGVAWQRPGWFVAEAIRGLMRGVPAGIVVVPVALAVICTGLASAWRRDRTAAAMMVLPMVLLAVPLVVSGHNLWPRFFFFGAGFVVQWGVRGGFALLDRAVPRLATRIGDAGLAAVTVASLALLPRAWAPKQDYPAAVAWLEEHAAPGDAIVGTEMMALPMNQWLGHDWPIVTDPDTLRAIEETSRRTWLLYTFPIRLEATAPGVWERLQRDYTIAATIPGSIGGGAIVIMTRPVP